MTQSSIDLTLEQQFQRVIFIAEVEKLKTLEDAKWALIQLHELLQRERCYNRIERDRQNEEENEDWHDWGMAEY